MTEPYWLSGGFRPFFLLGALAMAASVLAWIPVALGGIELPTAFGPRDWHVHALLFGGLMAIIAGFALTAVANWTGRPAVAGRELFTLVLLWAAGRIAVTTSAWIGASAAATVDILFPVALTCVFAREVIAARNLRNLRIVAIVGALGIADIGFHMEAQLTGTADTSTRVAISLALLLVMLVGGRIIPAFTRNWLVARKATLLPAAFSRLDAASVVVGIIALGAWTVAPQHVLTATLLSAAASLSAVRLARWRGLQTRSEPLLLILHVAFATIPLGFAAVALAILVPDSVDPTAAVHLWTVGTFGSITLAVMARASRGHSGQPLKAGRLEIGMFVLVFAGAAARFAAPYAEGWMVHTLSCAGLAWAAAYLLFAAGYGRMLLVRPRLP
ncbi:NnrS family protein [Chthonobacter albigriseus]|uniref:NnrS family protein n=1 Tax=Chthonobacter albigriseus TaxID=1683161 RepID=UPI0015EEB692|nr:NnrS family protein [Chthonobacter albigriseus]